MNFIKIFALLKILKKIILKFLEENKDKVKNLTTASREFYKDFCSLENIKKNYNKIFEEIKYFNNLWK